MQADLQVDYMGEGAMYPAFHPFAPVSSIFGYINLPDNINLNWADVYQFDFTLPVPIWNPFMGIIGLNGNVAYSFDPIDQNAGRWRCYLQGHIIRYKQRAFPSESLSREYTNPVDTISVAGQGSIKAKIYYGGFRG